MQSIDDESVSYLAELPHLRAINIYHTLIPRASLPLLVKKNPLLEKFALNPHVDPKRFPHPHPVLLPPPAAATGSGPLKLPKSLQ